MKPDLLDPLLSAVLAEDDTFRAASLRRTLALARRRRRERAARLVLAGVCLLAALMFLLRPARHIPVPLASAPPSWIVRTAPLAARQLIRTQAELFTPLASAPASIALLRSSPDAARIVATRTGAPEVERLTDRQLLAAFPSERPALIAAGTEKARLVFR